MNTDSESAQGERKDAAHRSSQLFLLRVWRAHKDNLHQDLQGKVQHTVTGQACYFANCSELVEILRRMVFQKEADKPE